MRLSAVMLAAFALTVASAGEPALPTLPKLDNGLYGYQEVVVIDGVETPELLSRARAWVAQTYGSAKVVTELDDNAAGILLIKGNFEIPWLGGSWHIEHVLKIEGKPGRYRYTLSNFELAIHHVPIDDDKALSDHVPTKNGREKMRGRIAVAASGVVASLKAAMQIPTPASSNW